jgi:hypothetical protein
MEPGSGTVVGGGGGGGETAPTLARKVMVMGLEVKSDRPAKLDNVDCH